MTKDFIKTMALCMVACLAILSCASTDPSGLSKAERQQQQAMMVQKALLDRNYTISVQSAHPTGGAPINLSSPYSLKVNGDTVVSYLPFFGRAYSVPYGGGKGLNFTGKVISYETSRNKKEYNIKMGVDGDEDQYIYYIDVYENGRAVILVASKNRSNITFYGEMDDQNLSAK